MSSFQPEINVSAVRLHLSIKSVNPRGGSAMIETENGTVVIFGGADRSQCHFQDMIVYSSKHENAVFEVVQGSGDVPTPRSGHSLVAYGKYVLLFGGIDFAEEVAYNDLYILNTETWEWNYVGESGHEVSGRNSHSMVILSDEIEQERVLVIYGGASPEKGTLSDTIYAFLPFNPTEIDIANFFVEWRQLPLDKISPPEREMHATTKISESQAIISGGRSQGSSELLSDLWVLTFLSSALRSSSASPLLWHRLPSILSPARCCHSSFVVSSTLPDSDLFHYAIFGGFTADGIAIDMQLLTLSLSSISNFAISTGETETLRQEWTPLEVNAEICSRFGQALCSLQHDFLNHLVQNKRYRPVLGSATVDAIEHQTRPRRSVSGCLVFGGVNLDQDFADLWLLRLS